MTDGIQTALRRGRYNEIIPPPLIYGLNPKDVLIEMEREADGATAPGQIAADDTAIASLAAMYAQSKRIAAVFNGEISSDMERALYEAVQVGVGVSVRPLGLESVVSRTFAPVLTRLDQRRWQIGIAKHGRTMVFDAEDAAASWQEACAIYRQWSEEEADETALLDEAVIRQTAESPFLPFWVFKLRVQGEINFGEYIVEADGPHAAFQKLHLPSGGYRILETSHQNAVHLGYGLALQNGDTVTDPSPREISAWLTECGVRPPTAVEWDRQSSLGLPARVFKDSDQFTLRLEPMSLLPRVVITDITSSVLKEIDLVPVLVEWFEKGREYRLTAAVLLTLDL